ncbi:MAG TPA: TonB-dependent receptor [Methylotenera sp.]|nr:TonB-dependent receptor [Methylotenera sp.]HPV44490.1 TonB-dependent receptor [Methylotenera sp.]
MHVFRTKKLSSWLALAGFVGLSLPVMADEAASTEQSNAIVTAPIVVTGTRVEQNSFDLPMSIDATDAEQIQEGQLKVNLSESSSRVPGVVINNRNNPAQDLAIQVRGFGARSAFGVRGVRLYADGIPMTMPDGQGQTGTFNLDTASRVEYLRGPFSALYGNSSGGVVQIFTKDGEKDPTLSGGITFGSYNTRRESIGFSDSGDGFDYIINANTYRSDGYRDQSDTRRDTLHGKINFNINDDTKLTVVATALDQPENEDPQGLTAAQLKADREQAGTNSELFNTRVSRDHQQVGATLEHNLTSNDTARLMAYYGQRDNEQFQSVSVAAQTSAPGFQRNGGGVAVIDRSFGGIDARWSHKGELASKPFNFTVGLNYDLMNDDRTGYQNFIGTTLGVKGILRRDEKNEARNFDQYAQASLDILPSWSVSGGVRHSRVSFKTKDHYIATGNGNDSGSVDFSETTPVLGTVFKLTDSVNLFANVGESFETPTFVEMAYNPDFNKSGLNLDLKPAKSRQYEVGAKAFVGTNTLVNAALFKIDTDDEIVVATSQGGRTTYRNVPTSERKGLELSLDSQLPHDVRLYLAYTLLDAKFTDSFSACQTPFPNGTSCRFGVAGDFETIASGSKIPGTYRYNLYGEVYWKHQPTGFSTALEMRKSSDTNVSFNSADGKADSYTVFNWRGGLSQTVNNWKFAEFVRIENIFDQEYVGSVRVADGNQRFYEAAPTRNWLLGLSAAYKF